MWIGDFCSLRFEMTEISAGTNFCDALVQAAQYF